MLESDSVASASIGSREAFPPARRWTIVLAGGVIVLAALVAYHNSFSVPFFFDDRASILENPTIRHLWNLREVLTPPKSGGVSGRPLVNLSLAVNYAWGGTEVWGYHAFNLAVHVLAGLVLFGIVRRTLAVSGVEGLRRASCRSVPSEATSSLARDTLPAPRQALGPEPVERASRLLQRDATLLALAIALLWTLHPLQTETVTCVVQRNESLMALFYLLTLYCFIRGAESLRPAKWEVLAVAACLAGMASKEVMVSAPLVVLLYDRTFVAGSFRAAWQRRRALYLGLACTWVLLGVLMVGSQKRGGTVGFGLGVSPWDYALTQCRAIALYLKLSIWPHPLVIDYGTALVKNVMEVWPQALLLVLLVAGTVVSLWRKPALGFAGAWFFAILAPSSSVVPLASQTMAEHRMYLPLAAVIALVVLGSHRLAGRRSLPVFLALAVGLGWLTVKRNEVYRSELSLWDDTVAHCPDNARAHTNLGNTLLWLGRFSEAIGQYEQALRLQPYLTATHVNLSNAYARLEQPAEAVEHGEAALRLDPNSADAHINLGNALLQLGRTAEAIGHYEAALRIQPAAADVHVNLGAALLKLGRVDEAIQHYEAASRLQPDSAEAHYDLAKVLMQKGDLPAAGRQYAEAVRLKPDYIEAHFALGNLFAQTERFAEAINEYKLVLRLAPAHALARNNLGNALLIAGRVDEAIAEYEAILRVRPNDAAVRENLEQARAMQRAAHPGF